MWTPFRKAILRIMGYPKVHAGLTAKAIVYMNESIMNQTESIPKPKCRVAHLRGEWYAKNNQN